MLDFQMGGGCKFQLLIFSRFHFVAAFQKFSISVSLTEITLQQTSTFLDARRLTLKPDNTVESTAKLCSAYA